MLNDALLEIFQPVLSLQKNRKVTLTILVVLLLLILITFYKMLTGWYADFSTVKPQATSQVTHQEQDLATRLVAALPSEHLFGQSLAADDFLPITSLQLHLTGLIKDANADQSQAIISEANQTGKIYSVGDELTAGIKIYAINADGIVLEHAGRLEKLPLVRNQLSFQDKPKALWDDSEA